MLWRAVSLLCVIERRRVVVLGSKWKRPSDVCCMFLDGSVLYCGENIFVCRRHAFSCSSATAARPTRKPYL